MKKLLAISLVATSLISSVFAQTLKVGATPIPHAEILEFIAPELKKSGIELDIKVFNDYVIPNIAVEDGDLDANFFQHIPYLNEFNKNKGTHLVKTVGVHLEPMGVYSKKIKSLNELKNGAIVSIPNDPTNESRALDVLASVKLIELDTNAQLRTPLDITKNPKNLKFKEIEAATLPRTLDDVDIAVINTNFAMNANLNPTKDAIVIETKDSPYVNILVVKDGNQNRDEIKALNKALQSQAVKDFIANKYKGSIVPAF
ncbi:MAG: MetQ/NlpA family ABC transporter substrate-binding protein [Campylobacter lanienae]|nr:MetQ/NlpA family ABC transporter substrate-binding protein [Campylobacter lanienae]